MIDCANKNWVNNIEMIPCYMAAMRACALRWRLRKNQPDWAQSEAKEMLESAVWYRKKIIQLQKNS